MLNKGYPKGKVSQPHCLKFKLRAKPYYRGQDKKGNTAEQRVSHMIKGRNLLWIPRPQSKSGRAGVRLLGIDIINQSRERDNRERKERKEIVLHMRGVMTEGQQ